MVRTLSLSVSLLIGLAVDATTLRAAELLMFEDPGCVWCRRWHAEVGLSYPNSAEGRRAPLRRIHIRNQETAGVSLASRVNVTPTFVVVDEGVEIGRIVGYSGSHFFYPMLDEILQRLPPLEPYRPPADRAALQTPARCAPA